TLLINHRGRSPGTAFSRDERNFQVLTLPEPPPPTTTTSTTEPADAGQKYRAAIAAFAAHRALYEDFAVSGTLAFKRLDQLGAIDLIVSATDGGASAPIFASYPAEVVNYDHTKEPIEALRTLGRVLVDRLALL